MRVFAAFSLTVCVANERRSSRVLGSPFSLGRPAAKAEKSKIAAQVAEGMDDDEQPETGGRSPAWLRRPAALTQL
jgi:hypothetical protein